MKLTEDGRSIYNGTQRENMSMGSKFVELTADVGGGVIIIFMEGDNS